MPNLPLPPLSWWQNYGVYSHEFPSSKWTKHLLWDLNRSSGQRSLNKLLEESLGRYKYLLLSTTSRSLPLFSSDAWEVKKSSFSETTWAGWMGMWRCSLIYTKSTPIISLKLIILVWTWLCPSFCECKFRSLWFQLLIWVLIGNNFPSCLHYTIIIISMNLLVVYRESVNLIGYITRRL